MVELIGATQNQCHACKLEAPLIYQRPDGGRFCFCCLVIQEMAQVRAQLQRIELAVIPPSENGRIQ